MTRVVYAVFTAAVLAASPNAFGQSEVAPKRINWADRKPDEARVERVLAALSQQEKIAQLLLAYPQIDKKGPVQVGGVLFVGNTLKKLDAAKERVRSSRERSRVPPFFAVDIEGGNFNRLKSHPTLRKLPSARELAEMETKDVERWGRKVGAAMIDVGLNVNLAPVFDVAPGGHMFRNGRSFAGDSKRVREKATAYARGMARAGVVPFGKHFPGYGDLDADSDHDRAVADWTKERIAQEAAVFGAAEKWLGGVMMSNIVYSAYSQKPAILEPQLVAMVHERGWITMTDDIAIQALADQIGADKAEVLRQAFLAGNDIILTTAPPDWADGLDYLGILSELVDSDPAHARQLDDTCRRVLRLKDRMGLLDAF